MVSQDRWQMRLVLLTLVLFSGATVSLAAQGLPIATVRETATVSLVIWLEGLHLPNSIAIAPAAGLAPVVGDNRP